MEQTMTREHGTRAKYVVEKCRCQPCTIANRLYARERDRTERRVAYGIEAPAVIFIDATETREHIQWLRKVGIGRRQIHATSRVALSTIQKIASGQLLRIRPQTADRILAVGRHRAAGGTLVDAKATWRLINDLLKHGWTKTQIARHINGNSDARALQISKTKIRKSTAEAVQQLHDQIMFRIVEERRLSNERTIKSRAMRATVRGSGDSETTSNCSNRSQPATSRT
jgi:hypothetical protein